MLQEKTSQSERAALALALLRRSPRRVPLANSQRRSTANPGPLNSTLRGFRQVTSSAWGNCKLELSVTEKQGWKLLCWASGLPFYTCSRVPSSLLSKTLNDADPMITIQTFPEHLSFHLYNIFLNIELEIPLLQLMLLASHARWSIGNPPCLCHSILWVWKLLTYSLPRLLILG